jgi:hypothetical protein
MSCFYRRNCSTTHSDAVVVATHYHYFFARFGSPFQGIFQFAETNTSGQHDDFIVTEFLVVFFVFEGQQ